MMNPTDNRVWAQVLQEDAITRTNIIKYSEYSKTEQSNTFVQNKSSHAYMW
jgi:hypothetical protein